MKLTVAAAPMISCLYKIAGGKHSFWIGVGVAKPSSARARKIGSGTERLSHSIMSESKEKVQSNSVKRNWPNKNEIFNILEGFK